MSPELRIGLWNIVLIAVQLLKTTPLETSSDYYHFYFGGITEIIWRDFFKKPGDEIPKGLDERQKDFRKFFFACAWYEVYDFIEFFADIIPWDNNDFLEGCNIVLKREVSAYRFVGSRIVAITSEYEIAAIEDALAATDTPTPLALVNDHLKQALTHFADRHAPDYRNSMKESISAVEGICKLITKDEKGTLGKMLTTIEASGKVKLHKALAEGFKQLYAYTSDAEGIRHTLKEASTVDAEDARYMLVMCAGFVSYFIEKATKAGITF
jgi:hypothetical protein